jgi:hypothetical protein
MDRLRWIWPRLKKREQAESLTEIGWKQAGKQTGKKARR